MEMKTPLRVERERRGWTQEYVAERVGVTSPTICRIEAEGVRATETAQKLQALLGNSLSLEQICAPERYMIATEPTALEGEEMRLAKVMEAA